MKPHPHVCRCCWDVFSGCDCAFPWMEYAVCPSCRFQSTFYEATKHWKVIKRADHAA